MRSSTLAIIVLAAISQSTYARPIGVDLSRDQLSNPTIGDVAVTNPGIAAVGNGAIRGLGEQDKGDFVVSDAGGGTYTIGNPGPAEGSADFPPLDLITGLPIDTATGVVAGTLSIAGF